MDSGDRVVEISIKSFPRPLQFIIQDYQKDRLLPSFSRALLELLETHPEIDKRIKAIYASGVEHLEHLEH